ncbi:Hpt domain-containing protein [Flavobacterium sp. SUN052]|uniref:Hpt domain-containing protein n=1 Tax=Flavobacterium sp. SUN052 TaxID=3002441 RepID=UPI00237E3F42|nr:Hpt domain-containing protein [Flavobacterium sp. SUN052]MEC4003994.1 Hpt domain-containing protein [Flavobacterium sp. SUN052]
MELPNTEYIDQLSAGNEEFRAKMVSIIKMELPLEIDAYQDKIQTQNYKIAAECVHKLKHKISVLGLEKSYYIAEQFEDNLKEGSTNLQIEFEKTLALMQEFVNCL